MFLLDDILLMPAHGLLTVFRELDKAVHQEFANEGEAIRTELSELYMMLETGQITEEEFDRQEKELLDRLDDFEERRESTDAEEADEDTEEAGEDDAEEADEDADETQTDEQLDAEAEVDQGLETAAK